jgi:hypothetical protein
MRLITLRRRIDEVCWPASIDGRALKLELVVVVEELMVVVDGLLKLVVVELVELMELVGLIVVVVV